jgi:hypothetical protein
VFADPAREHQRIQSAQCGDHRANGAHDAPHEQIARELRARIPRIGSGEDLPHIGRDARDAQQAGVLVQRGSPDQPRSALAHA